MLKAFILALRYFTESALLTSEYGVTADPEMARRFPELTFVLKERGPIYGIGIQCHAFEIDPISPFSL